MIGLADTGSKKAKNFSLGMKQRLALGTALITEPRFLILDEPVNGLDPIGIIEIRALMQRLALEKGITILVSSHILDELAQIATHYGIIHKGDLIKQFSADELAKENRKYIRIANNDTAKTLELLRTNMGITNFEVDDKAEIRVYEKLDAAGKMNTLLVRNGIEVESIGIVEQRLEDYFVKLTGGNI
jgi:ABC-2 type transport system ATP-binding protein